MPKFKTVKLCCLQPKIKKAVSPAPRALCLQESCLVRKIKECLKCSRMCFNLRSHGKSRNKIRRTELEKKTFSEKKVNIIENKSDLRRNLELKDKPTGKRWCTRGSSYNKFWGFVFWEDVFQFRTEMVTWDQRNLVRLEVKPQQQEYRPLLAQQNCMETPW